jgi:hypothetical protein
MLYRWFVFAVLVPSVTHAARYGAPRRPNLANPVPAAAPAPAANAPAIAPVPSATAEVDAAGADAPLEAQAVPTGEAVLARLGPAAEEAAGAYVLTITRDVRQANGSTQRWVERQVRGPGLDSAEVVEPVRMGHRREGGRMSQLTPEGTWAEVALTPVTPPAPVTVAAGAEAGKGPVTPTVTWRGPHEVVVRFARAGGEQEEWDVDWAHRVRTARRWRTAEGGLLWEDTLEEEWRDGMRWLRHAVRRNPHPGGWNFEETWTWE